jgi:hypothetical protein
MGFNQPTYGARATENFEYTKGISPGDVVGGRFNDIAAYLGEVQRAKASALITIPLAQGTTNNELANFIPAGTLVTSLGIFFTEKANIDTGGTLAVGFGDASADVSIVASTALNASGTDIVINSFTSTSSKHALTSGGNAIPFAADSALYFVNTSSLWFQTIVGTADLTATCDVKVVMEYLKVSNS